MDGVDVGGTIEAVEIVAFWFDVLTDVSVDVFSLSHTNWMNFSVKIDIVGRLLLLCEDASDGEVVGSKTESTDNT